MVETQSIPAPLPFRRASAPVPVACLDQGSSALRITRRHALIVDDCRFIAERMARVLERRCFACTVVSDGYQGLEVLRQQRFDVVVLEVNTSMVDGFTLLRYLRRDPQHARVPALMLSTERSTADHDRAVALGANGYMSKPLQLRPLNAMLDSLLD